LITLSPSDLGLWFVSLAGIKTAITRGVQGDPRAGAPPVRPIMKLGRNPVLVIRDLLKQCDDEAPHPETSAIPFVDDPELRQSLRNDLDEAWASMRVQKWKSATVMAGAALEGLLLWAISHARWNAKAQSAAQARGLKHPPERWELQHYIPIAAEIGLIDGELEKQADLCRDFRNLIHPGRAIRLDKQPTKGRALGALSAVESLVERFSALFPMS
jgi:hypothetical protein